MNLGKYIPPHLSFLKPRHFVNGPVWGSGWGTSHFTNKAKFFKKKAKIVSSEHILLALFSSKRTTNYLIGINYMRIRRFKCLASLIDRKNVLQILDFFLCSFSYFPRRVHEVHILPLREIF